MFLEKLEVSSFLMNCYIVGCEKTNDCAIIDPGGSFEYIEERITALGLNPKMILLTHGHSDHIGAVEELKNKYNIPICVHEFDSEMIKEPELNYSYDVFRKKISLDSDMLLKDGQIIELGELKISVIHTPGHTRGSACYKIEDIILSGDTLFNNTIGRTDLGGGSMDDIINSIVNKLLVYNDEVKVYPGHGSETSIGDEKKANPYVKNYIK
jgi:glyoxylase-like metal-dependent hydrolase (beta-lactamase superfamily II)